MGKEVRGENKTYYKYWGKAEKDATTYHLLPYHCLDVAAVGWLLFSPEKDITKKNANRLEINTGWLQKWMAFCLCLHDLGKFSAAFQGLVPNMSPVLVKAKGTMLYSERHDMLGFILWKDYLGRQFIKNIFADDMDDKGKSELLRNIEPWIKIVTGHHGEPPKNKCIRYQEYFTEEDEKAAEQYMNTIIKMLLGDVGFDELKDKSVRNKLKLISWTLAGAVVISDWLGSSRDVEEYVRKPVPLKEYWNDYALPFAGKIILNIEQAYSKTSPYSSIENLFPFIESPTPLQRWAEKCQLSKCNQLIILEDITGAGKTEAAMILAHRMMASDAASGIYIALPTMATANAMYSRLAKVYRKLFTEESKPSLVLAHGAAHLSDGFRSSIGFPEQAENIEKYAEDDETANAYCSHWISDNRKKALLAEVGVGTLDQALLGVLPARHQSLRLFGLSGKILLVDEVHAYDPYMNQLLQKLIEYHSSQGGNTILLSATLPKQLRGKYTDAFRTGIGRESVELKEDKAYPLVTFVSEDEPEEIPISPAEKVKRSVDINLINTTEDALRIIKGATEDGKCVCWIRNTVKDARVAYDLVEQNKIVTSDKLILFHSRFAMIDRQRIEKKSLKIFGKESTADQRNGQVLIATQVVEQSLDLDFDVLITDLAPVDLIIQRAGRLKRHIRDCKGNPLMQGKTLDQRGEAQLHILGPVPTKSPDKKWLESILPGTQAVYKNVGHLWLTQQALLEGTITMPDDARQLIEDVYAPGSQNHIPEKLERLSNEAKAIGNSQRGMAGLNVLKLDQGYTALADTSGGWTKEVNIPTRLADNSITLAFAKIEGGKMLPYAETPEYAWDLSMIDIPEYEWKKIKNKILPDHSGEIEKLKQDIKLLKWVEVVPLTGEISTYYDKDMGWNIEKEEG